MSYNRQFQTGPAWGALAGGAACATAVGPGAALALASPSGHVASYLRSPSQASASVLSRCPLTVVDLETTSHPERPLVPASADAELTRIVADLPSGATLLVTAPGSTASPPHLQLILVDGPGYQTGLLESSSTRRPGLVALTDLTPTVLGWLARRPPPGAVGAQLTRGSRGRLPATIRSLAGRDTAEQVWLSTHHAFFWAYLLADALVFGALWLARRPQWWRVAGVFAVSVPAGTFLANLLPWWRLAHPAAWLYGSAVALALVIALAALAGTRRRDPLAPFGVLCLFTLAVLGLDVMTGSRRRRAARSRGGRAAAEGPRQRRLARGRRVQPAGPGRDGGNRADAVAARVVRAEDRAAGLRGRAADPPGHGRAVAHAGTRLAGRRLGGAGSGRRPAGGAAPRHRRSGRRRIP